MDIETVLVTDKHGDQRLVCVVDGQPYYQSSGKNSQNAGIWYPFYGIDWFDTLGDKPAYTQFVKPDVASDSRSEISDCFPESVVDALFDVGMGSKDQWSRFGNMQGLYVACLLSEETTFPEALRKAVAKELGLPDIKPQIALHVLKPTREKSLSNTKKDAKDINDCLLELGANIALLPDLESPLNLDGVTHDFGGEAAELKTISPAVLTQMIAREEAAEMIRAVKQYRDKHFPNDDIKKAILETGLAFLREDPPKIEKFTGYIQNNEATLGARDVKGLTDVIQAIIHTLSGGRLCKTPGQRLKESLQQIKQEGLNKTSVAAVDLPKPPTMRT